jgi:Helix-turn-helix domain
VILRRDSAPRRALDPVDPASVPDLARSLRQVRLQRGLDLEEAAAACGLPVGQLEDFEAGTVSRLPDRVAVLKGLRRYADSLGLPGERYVLVMVEHWPDDEVVTSSVLTMDVQGEAVAMGAGPIATATTAVTTGPEANSLFLVPETLTTTAALPAYALPAANGSADGDTVANGAAAWANGSADGDATTDQVPIVLADTGVTPAVRAWRPRVGTFDGDSATVQYLSGFLAVLLVIGCAWLGINHWRPQWLRSIHIPYTSKSLPAAAGAPKTTTPTSAGSTAPSSTTATTTAPPVTTPQGHGTLGKELRITSVAGDHATFAVRASKFVVQVHCVGGDAWVQVSGSTPTPVFAQIVPENGTKNFQGEGQLTMVIGSSAARLTILHGKKVIGTYTPPSAPFSMTFSSTR